ncbi:calcium-binding protein [Nisaea acidiphila]|uniref:Calcium-binding protein n=1 Tax=Nisaea acidiphila TaxID=1862145 RepID=A0A9J7AU92_9PROT|nr:calcium-binding protein [Nisaea acidiphila]UUX51299.1 calcium-binding protein [Nisaea acidiphila]
MASLPGGFDPALNLNIDTEQSILIRDFLDQIGVSESSVEEFTAPGSDVADGSEGLTPVLLPADMPYAAANVAADQQISIILNPDASDGSVLIIQGEGHARIRGGDGNDKIQGGSGNDTVTGGLGDDQLRGGAGDDEVFGGIGDDLIYGNKGNDTIGSDEGADRFFGGQGNDEIAGGNDDDILAGNRDADLLYGNSGFDILYGNQQDDTLFGGAGDDTLYGGQNADTLIGGRGDDALHGNLGGDQFVFQSNSGVDVIYDFVAGTDMILVASNINGLQVTEASDLLDRISSDATGNAVIDFGSGNLVTIDGLSATDLANDIASYITIN